MRAFPRTPSLFPATRSDRRRWLRRVCLLAPRLRRREQRLTGLATGVTSSLERGSEHYALNATRKRTLSSQSGRECALPAETGDEPGRCVRPETRDAIARGTLPVEAHCQALAARTRSPGWRMAASITARDAL